MHKSHVYVIDGVIIPQNVWGGGVHPLPLLDEILSTKSKNELLITVMLFMIVYK